MQLLGSALILAANCPRKATVHKLGVELVDNDLDPLVFSSASVLGVGRCTTLPAALPPEMYLRDSPLVAGLGTHRSR